MDNKVRVVHYINQFFAQIGGEEKANITPQIKKGPVGPGMLLQKSLADRAEVVATVICGDNYFSTHIEKARKELLVMIESQKPDLLIAGPAFIAGRYGIACGEICKSVNKELGIPCVTGMFKENPGVEIYRKFIYIIDTPETIVGMKESLPKSGQLALKLYQGQSIGTPAEEGYFPRGIRKNVFSEKLASERVIDILIAKLSGKSYLTEISMPLGISIEAAPPVAEISKSTIALVTEGALVPKGNPDNIESSRATKFGRYPVWSKDVTPSKKFECIHRGFDISFVTEDPNRLLPINALREMEENGYIGKLFPFFYTTNGTGTFLNEAKRMGREIAQSLKNEGIDGVILAAT